MATLRDIYRQHLLKKCAVRCIAFPLIDKERAKGTTSPQMTAVCKSPNRLSIIVLDDVVVFFTRYITLSYLNGVFLLAPKTFERNGVEKAFVPFEIPSPKYYSGAEQ